MKVYWSKENAFKSECAYDAINCVMRNAIQTLFACDMLVLSYFSFKFIKKKRSILTKVWLLPHRQLRRSFRIRSPITFPFSYISFAKCESIERRGCDIHTHARARAYSKRTHTRCFGVIFTALSAYANISFYAYSLPPLSHRFHSLTHATSASWVFFLALLYFIDKLIKRFINVCM